MPTKPTTKDLETRLIEPANKVEKVMEDGDKNRVLKKLFSVLLLAALFMAIEIAGGIISNSIAILSDAAHMLSDLLGFVISILSVYISGLPANKQHSYGYHRAGVIGALVSVMVIWVLTAFLIYYAIERVANLDQVDVEGPLMFGIACFGLLTNLVMIKVLHGGGHGHGHSHGHSHGDSHGHGHDHSHEMCESPKRKKVSDGHNHDSHKHEHEHKHSHEDDHHHHEHDHDHDHEHKHEHEHEHDHDDHDHEHNHEHDHDHGHGHSHKHSEKTVTTTIGNINNPSVSSSVGIHVHDHDDDHDHDHHSPKNLSRPADHENMNVRATIIHIFGDILQSIGVIIASTLIWINPNWKIADPIVTFIFAIIVLYTTIRIVKDCIFVLMEGTPAEFDLDEFEMKIKDVQGVIDVHDLHVWTLGVGKPAMSAHIYADGKPSTILKKVTKVCNIYGITHTTIQVETTKDEGDEDYIDCKHNIH